MEQQKKVERKKIFDALNKCSMGNAKIYTETIIRNRKEALNLKRVSFKMGALSA